MLRFFTLVLLLSAFFLTQAQTHTPKYVSMSSNARAYYEYLPEGYDAAGTTTYPLILFMTGIGEFYKGGSDTALTKVLRNGIPRLIEAGKFPKSVSVNGETFRFLVITPQFKFTPAPQAPDMDSVLNYIVAHYKVDTNRIYITGLSYGGGLCWAYAGANNTYAQRVAAIVPVASPFPEGGDSTIYARSRVIAANNVAVWATHNRYDRAPDSSLNTITYINDINQAPAPTPLARMSIFEATGHNAWDRTYDPARKEFDGMNVYEWLLKNTRGTVTANQPPTAAAGADQSITLTTSSVTLSGTGTDADGSITTYTWTKVAGPSAGSITAPNASKTTVIGLVQGAYVFRLTVTDNAGATATDDVTITVNAAPNQAPTVNAGADQTLTLPDNSLTLTGTASDPDGSIAQYAWTKVSGTAESTIVNPDKASTSVSGLVAGTYVFRLTVTDNSGATASDDVTVTVKPVANQAPVANAGADVTITLPTSSATLSGSGSDADGSIATYAWTKVSGSAGGDITTPDAATTAVTALQKGSYVFRLTVSDNSGATSSDDVTVIVNAAPNQLPKADAGADQSITSPVNSVQLNGSGTDADGTISIYNWTIISGPDNSSIASPDKAATVVNNLVQGVYTFRLTVTDNAGATAFDDVTVTVNAAANKTPQADAGADTTITLPLNQVNLTGNGTDEDGTIASYLWTQVSGPVGAVITPANAASTSVTELVQGLYTFRLTVTDNAGATASDDVIITVNAAVNQPPTVDAGADQTITLPLNTVILNGTATDPDGNIAQYAWTKVSGPNNGAFSHPDNAATTMTGLTQGTYVVRLTVTDNNGAVASDDVTINVLAAPVNQPSHVDAGPDQHINLPATSVMLHGSATDSDGSIATYQWTKVSGPAGDTITTPNSDSTLVTGLQQGSYVFRLTVTDDKGDTASAEVTVIVSVVTAVGDDPATASRKLLVMPNPTSTYFTLKLLSASAKPAFVQVADAVGRVVEQRNKVQRNTAFTLGETYRPGVYYVQLVQDGEKLTVKLLKLP